MLLTILQQEEIPIAVFLPIILVVVVFIVMRRNLSRRGAFGRLAERYGSQQSPDLVMGERVTIRVVRLGMLNYKNFFRFIKTNKGLYMYPIWFFRSKEVQGVLIPWDHFTRIEPFKRLWVKMVRLHIGRPEITTMEIPQRAFDNIRDKVDIKSVI